MAELCRMVGCIGSGTLFCEACGEASYCSVACQKEDWKVHKLSCVDMKKLPLSFLSMSQIDKFSKRVNARANVLNSAQRWKTSIHVGQMYLAFLNHQYGEQVEGQIFCKRSNGDLIDNYLLITARLALANMCYMLADVDNMLVFAKSARRMAEPRDRSDDASLNCLMESEKFLTSVYFEKQQLDVAEQHCQHCMMFAKLIKGELAVPSMYQALKIFTNLRILQSRIPEAITLSEEAYIILKKAHGPVHPDVQQAAWQLISCLMRNKNYTLAEDCSRMNYENLTDPRNGVDQEGPQVGAGMTQLVNLWLAMEPPIDEKSAFALAEEAEDLIRKSCRIMQNWYARDSDTMITQYRVFADVLLKRSKYTDETRMVLERAIAICYRENSVSLNLDRVSFVRHLAHFHDHVNCGMPPGEDRDVALQLRDVYLRELEGLNPVGMLHASSISSIWGIEE